MIEAVHNNVIVELLSAVESKTPSHDSNIYIPKILNSKISYGKIISVGPGRMDNNGNRIPVNINVLDKIYFLKQGGHEIHSQGKLYICVNEYDILAKG